MRFYFPYYRRKPEYIQPDPKLWSQVKIGMSAKEVVDLLGPPLSDRFRGGKPKKAENGLYCYGWLDIPFVPHPRTYSFHVYFDKKAKVSHREDPFKGDISHDQIPTKPFIIIPQSGVTFSHYPRIVDIRWRPPAGAYPMKFEVERGASQPSGGPFFDEVCERDLRSVYHCFSFVGAQPGRLRIRARNSFGLGPWSDYIYFTFTV